MLSTVGLCAQCAALGPVHDEPLMVALRNGHAGCARRMLDRGLGASLCPHRSLGCALEGGEACVQLVLRHPGVQLRTAELDHASDARAVAGAMQRALQCGKWGCHRLLSEWMVDAVASARAEAR